MTKAIRKFRASSTSTYPLNQSPLFKLSNKKRLAALFGLTPSELNNICKTSHYREFTTIKNGKSRDIQAPCAALEIIQHKILKLLQRIDMPEYLHSGRKKRSHITNAHEHKRNTQIAKLDIKGFYPSVPETRVYHLFKNTFNASPDIAKILCALTTYKDCLPTGSKTSQIIAFLSNKDMFQEIQEEASSLGIKFSLYVDDLTFSGTNIPPRFLWRIKGIIHKNGYKYHKEYRSTPNKLAVITGVAINAGELTTTKKIHLKIHEHYKKYLNGTISKAEFETLKGLLSSVSEYDLKHASILRHINAKSTPTP